MKKSLLTIAVCMAFAGPALANTSMDCRVNGSPHNSGTIAPVCGDNTTVQGGSVGNVTNTSTNQNVNTSSSTSVAGAVAVSGPSTSMATGGDVKIMPNAFKTDVKVNTKGTVGDVNGGSVTISEGAVQNSNSQQQGQQQGIFGSGNSTNVVGVSTKGTVGDVTSTSGVKNSGNSSVSVAEGAVQNTVSTGSQSQSVNTQGTVGNVSTGEQANSQSTSITMGDNESTVAAAKLAADAQVEAARIAAEAAAAQSGTRDLTEAQQRELDRQAAIEIAKINSDVKVRNTPSVNGPPLVSSNDTCMGSTSGSANGPGIGIGFGTTWVDGNCKMLKNSRELWNMGFKAAAVALMCNDADNRAALEATGFECPQTAKARQESAAAAPATASGTYAGNDPIVRARLGLN